MTILFKLTTRSRPRKAIETLISIYENVRSDNFMTIVSLDTDDITNSEFVKGIASLNKLKVCFGEPSNKILAINRDVPAEGWDILINVSDDMKFIVQGFDEEIRKDFGDNLDQFIHYNDGNQKANVSTMSIIGKTYYERFGYIYYPEYQSLWSDCEEMDKAFMLGKYKYMGDDKILFRHLHPAWGLTEWDSQYRKSEHPDFWQSDRAVIDKRRMLKYELPLNEIVNGFRYENL